MVGVTAGGLGTEVVHLHTFRDWTNPCRVGKAVDPVRTPLEFHLAIILLVPVAPPDPAGSDLTDIGEDPFADGCSFGGGEIKGVGWFYSGVGHRSISTWRPLKDRAALPSVFSNMA